MIYARIAKLRLGWPMTRRIWWQRVFRMPIAMMVLVSVAGYATSQEENSAKPDEAVAGEERARVDEERARELVTQFDAATFQQREQAETELRVLGERALLALDAATTSANPEIRLRALALAKEIRARPSPQPLGRKLDSRPIVEKQGELAKDERWTAANVYSVTGNLVVRNGATLTIEPGTFVVVAEGKDINVHARGSLIAKSDDKDNPIVITSLSEAKDEDGVWGKLLVHGNVDLRNVQVRRSKGVVLRYARGVNMPLAGIARPTSNVNGLSVYDTDGDAVVLERPTKKCSDVSVREARGVGIAIREYGSNVKDVRISGAQIGMQNDGATSEVTGVTIGGCGTGLVVANKGALKCSDVTVSHCSKFGIHANHGSIRIGPRCKVEEINGTGVYRENRSSVNVEALRIVKCRDPVVDGPDR